MWQLDNNAVSNGIKTASARFVEIIAIGLLGRGAAENVTLKFLKQWLKKDKLFTAVVKQLFSSSLFVWLVARFIKHTSTQAPAMSLDAFFA